MDGKRHKRTAGLCLLFSFSIILLASRCDDDKPFASQLLTFIIPTLIVPADSLLTVGDTLWIVTDTSDSLLEYHTKRRYKLADFDFGSSFAIRELTNKLKNLGDQTSAALTFDQIAEVGEILFPGETFVEFKYKYDNNRQRYMLKIGLIPKKTGVFCINFLSPKELDYDGIVNVGRHKNGATIIPVYEDIFFPVNDGNNNFELFKKYSFENTEQYPNDYRGMYYIRYGTFTFRVIE